MMMMPPDEHASMSPSRLQRIIDCPGSYRVVKKLEDEEGDQGSSSYAQEGSHMHLAVETHLNKHEDRFNEIKVSHNVVSPALTDEQLMAVQDCIDYLAKVIAPLRHDPSLILLVERRVYLKEFHQVLYNVDGTCDIIIKTHTETHAIDWKFGKGVPVYVEDNDQLLAYLAGAISSYDVLFEEGRKFFCHVVQPRLEVFDSLELTAKEIDQWLNSRLIPGVSKALEKHAPFFPGQSQCRWCAASARCRARYNMANQTAADVFQAATNLPDKVTIDEIAELLSRAAQLEAYIKSLRVYVQRRIEQGKPVPGWKVVHGRSLRRWKDADKAAEALLDRLDMAQVYTSKLVSPAQAEEADRSMKKEDWFLGLIEKPEGKHTLVNANDKRQPIEFRTMQQIFAEAIK